MILGGAIRFSQWDIDAKKATPIMCQALLRLSGQVDHMWVYANKLTDPDMFAFVRALPKLAGFLVDSVDFREGWVYQGNPVLDHMLQIIDKPVDWIMFPDSDDLLPSNVRQEVEKAESLGMTCIEFPRIEPRGEMIMDTRGQIGGPHVLGAKWKPDWKNSEGFNIPSGTPPEKIYHCPWPSRHMRYATEMLIAARKAVSYHEDYALKEWALTPFREDWTHADYERHFAALPRS